MIEGSRVGRCVKEVNGLAAHKRRNVACSR